LNGEYRAALVERVFRLSARILLAAAAMSAAGCGPARSAEPAKQTEPAKEAEPAKPPADAPAASTHGSGAPEYRCRRATSAIAVDGDIGDAAWKDAVWVALQPAEHPPGEHKVQRARAAALYDDRFLYVAWDCDDDEIVSSLKNRDDPVWSQDCVEFFLSQKDDDGVYFEFEVSPDGVLFDALIIKDRPRRHTVLSWNPPKVAAAAKRRDGGYVVELAVPFSETFRGRRVPPWHGDRWRGNFYRIDCGKGGAFDYGFSPVRDFHDTSKFCVIVFEDPEGERAAAEDASTARQWLGGTERAGWWTLAEHLDSAAVSSPGAGPYARTDDGFRSPRKGGMGRLARPRAGKGQSADFLRGELSGHPEREGEPLVVEVPAASAGRGAICCRIESRAVARIASGEADGVDFIVELLPKDGSGIKRLARLRANREEWLARKFEIPAAGTLRITVTEGPETLSYDSFRMILDIAPAAER
jgi:hypothetical protein